ncbi:TrmH family RNA methyltransferase [Sphingomonas sp. LaA6.9]|uniref:TrmH family RNA methyltransferase n=1 Tax=Sphingomonas sp. LaA6.9 TaxID=2919914 RepID=UPI001F4F87C2|nr:TrmH family RNA methyltransferase [Sphingomonas sp. LaA6.9]MCJ8157425.1 GIY-YIG nuclease family protein [Sphingomonas sp. LaA6.9]
MSFFTYMLRCADGSYYVGHTDNLEARVGQHQHGEIEGYTQSRRPIELIWSDSFPDRDQAFAVEQRLKGWSRAKKEALIRGDWDAVRALSRRGAILRDETSPGSASPQDERNQGNNAISAHAGEGLSEGEGLSRSAPAIVLVRPQLGENIGKAARAMLNFGLTEMRLVAPRDGWPNPSAGPAASGADIVLERAQVFESVADAVADCQHIYATTVRKRGVTKPVVTPEVAAQEMRAARGRSAILFGPERSGLETDDVAVARKILTVPINPEFGSLNLAQAVILVAYEWSKGEALASPPSVEIDPPAPQDELDGMIGQLDAMLDKAGYFFPPDRAPSTRRTLRTLLTKPGWNSMEVRTLRGVLSSLANPRQR